MGKQTVLITGNTFPVKDALKALGGRWDSTNKGWLVPASNADKARSLVATAPKAVVSQGGRSYGRRSKECISGGNCSSFGSGRNCGGHDCDGY